VLSSLTEAPHGPSSLAMVQAVEPYITWLLHRRAAISAAELLDTGRSGGIQLHSLAVVHPSEVSANSIRLAQLLANNRLGATLLSPKPKPYQDMWVNNSAAMYAIRQVSDACQLDVSRQGGGGVYCGQYAAMLAPTK